MQTYQTHSLNLNKQLRKISEDKKFSKISRPNNKNYPMRPIIKSYSQSKRFTRNMSPNMT